MKTRETTQEERYEIVKACIDSGLDYGATAEKYKVSYSALTISCRSSSLILILYRIKKALLRLIVPS